MSEVMRQLWPKKPGLPKEEDVLFRTSEVLGEQDDMAATVAGPTPWLSGVGMAGKWAAFIDGYRYAGRGLQTWMAEHPLDWPKDAMLYPLVFLYRHHWEINMKVITLLGAIANGQADKIEAPKNTHDLDDIWSSAREHVASYAKGATPEVMKIIDSLVAEMCCHDDPKGTKFRYPVDRKNEENLAELRGKGFIDIENFVCVAEKVSELLGETFGELWQKTEFDELKKESDAEWTTDVDFLEELMLGQLAKGPVKAHGEQDGNKSAGEG